LLEREDMPKLKWKTLLIVVAATMLSTSAALAEANPDDRSYLPPQAKEPAEKAVPQASVRTRSARYRTPHHAARSRYALYREHRHYARHHAHRRYAHHRTHRHYAHWRSRHYASRGFFPGFFFGLFR
jgi:hypothetical protein